jgi:cell wall-associated NlpC family hydrolase
MMEPRNQHSQGTMLLEAGTWGCVMVSVAPVRRDASDSSEQVSQLLCGELAEILSKGERDWVYVRCLHDGYQGWCDGKQMFHWTMEQAAGMQRGVTLSLFSKWVRTHGDTSVVQYLSMGSQPWRMRASQPGEAAATSAMPFWEPWEEEEAEWIMAIHKKKASTERALTAAEDWMGVPYLWGGRSAHGVDCSGLIQVTAAMGGIRLPRDASQQWQALEPVDWSERRRGDLAFFTNPQGQIIHVAWLLSPETVLHAAGEVRKDGLTPQGIVRRRTGDGGADEEGVLTHVLAGIRRLPRPGLGATD